MKKLFACLILFVFGMMVFAYSKPKNTDSIEVVKTGLIKVYGNEPFTFLGLVSENDEIYSIKASDDILAELRKSKGHKIEIKGIIEKPEEMELNQLKDGFLIVLEWKVIK